MRPAVLNGKTFLILTKEVKSWRVYQFCVFLRILRKSENVQKKVKMFKEIQNVQKVIILAFCEKCQHSEKEA